MGFVKKSPTSNDNPEKQLLAVVSRMALGEALAGAVLVKEAMRIHILGDVDGLTVVADTPSGSMLTYTETIEAENTGKGRTAVDTKLLTTYVKALPKGGTVELSLTQSDKLRIEHSDGPKTDLNTVELEEPELIPIRGGLAVVDVKAFNLAIDQVLFSVSTDESRPYCTGVFFEPGDGLVKLVTTDGHRLSSKDLPLTLGNFGENGIVPEPLLKLTAKAFKGNVAIGMQVTIDEEEKFDIETKQNKTVEYEVKWFVVTNGKRTVYTKTIVGKFPNYNCVIPDPSRCKGAQADKKALLDCIPRLKVTADDNMNIRFFFNRSELTLKTNDPDRGTSTEYIDLVNSTFDECLLGYNLVYLTDALKHIKGRTVKLESTECGRQPLRITDTSDDTVLYVLMPVRIVV